MAGARCTACGQANPDGAKFCNECGAPLARAAGHEVRKTLTVLFADLVGLHVAGRAAGPGVAAPGDGLLLVAIVAPGVGTRRERWIGQDRRTDAA